MSIPGTRLMGGGSRMVGTPLCGWGFGATPPPPQKKKNLMFSVGY